MLEAGVPAPLGHGTVPVRLDGGKERGGKATRFGIQGVQYSGKVPAIFPLPEPQEAKSGGHLHPFGGIRTAQGGLYEVAWDLEPVQGLLPHLQDHGIPGPGTDIGGTHRRVMDGRREIVRGPPCDPPGPVVHARLSDRQTVGPDASRAEVDGDLPRGEDPGGLHPEALRGPGRDRCDPGTHGVPCRMILPVDHGHCLRIPVAVKEDPALLVQDPPVTDPTTGIPFREIAFHGTHLR